MARSDRGSHTWTTAAGTLSDRDQAARRNHLTARHAGSSARRIGAKRIVPFHFSPRYIERPEDLAAEAIRAFGATTPAAR